MSGEWVHGSAAYVRARGEGERDAWSGEAAARGRVGTQRIVRAGEVETPGEVAALLGVPEGEEVVERCRVMYLDGAATELTTTYYPLAIARGTPLAETAKIRGGAVTLLARLGHTAAAVREEVRARLPAAAEREALGIAQVEPVLELVRLTLDGAGTPFQVDVSVFRSTAQRLRYEMKVD